MDNRQKLQVYSTVLIGSSRPSPIPMAMSTLGLMYNTISKLSYSNKASVRLEILIKLEIGPISAQKLLFSNFYVSKGSAMAEESKSQSIITMHWYYLKLFK